MGKVFDFMSKDHDRLEEILKNFSATKTADMNKADRLFHEFKAGLEKHIEWEEEILFPLFEDRTGMHGVGPTAVMRQEHARIKQALEKIHDKIVAHEASGISELEKLVSILRSHNDKEENILYPEIDDILDEKQATNALEQIKTRPASKPRQCCE